MVNRGRRGVTGPYGISLLLAVLTVLGSLTLASSASARPGDLDQTYGSHGIGGPYVSGLRDSGGGLLSLASSPAEGIVLRRVTEDGLPDAEFGVDGAVAVDKPGASGTGLALRPDGGVLVITEHHQPRGACPCTYFLHGFSAAGEPDPSLDDVQLPIDGVSDPGVGASNMVVTPSGRILLAADQGIVGLTPEGKLDPAFGSSGRLYLGGYDASIYVDPAGGYIAVTVLSDGGYHEPITRIDGDGVVDTDWAGDGTYVAWAPNDTPAVSVSAAGRVAIADNAYGERGDFIGVRPHLEVLAPDGTPVLGPTDTPPTLAKNAEIHDLDWDSSERLLIAGTAGTLGALGPLTGAAFIARLRPTGSLDSGFADGGVGLFPADFSTFPGSSLNGISFEPDGRILASADGTSIRFLAEPGGPSDADADGLPDAKDRCPRRYAEAADGCAHSTGTITGSYSSGVFSGRVTAVPACLKWGPGTHRTVTLFKRLPGRFRRVARVAVDGDGYWFDRKRKGRRYYVRLDRQVIPGVAVCEGARTGLLPAPPTPAG